MSDWSSVGYASDPIPGDPASVQNYANYYMRVAAAIADTAVNLRSSVASADVESQAITEFKELALDVANNVSEIDDRYTVVASALTTYAIELDRLRGEAAAVALDASDAVGDIDTANWRIHQYTEQINDPTTPPANVPYLQSHLQDAQQDLANANYRVLHATNKVADLITERAAAADKAAQAIQDCIKGSELNDTAWDRLVHLVEQIRDASLDFLEALVDVLDALLPILDVLSTILTIVAIILVFTGVGAAVAAALFTIARVMSIVSIALKAVKLGAETALAVAGRRTWADVAFTAVDLGVSILTLGKAKATPPVKQDLLIDYLGKDRLADGAVDLVGYVTDAIDGDLELTPGDFLLDMALTGGEQGFVDAAVTTVSDPGAAVDAVQGFAGDLGNLFGASTEWGGLQMEVPGAVGDVMVEAAGDALNGAAGLVEHWSQFQLVGAMPGGGGV